MQSLKKLLLEVSAHFRFVFLAGFSVSFDRICRIVSKGFSLPSIKCNPDPARLSPDDVTLVIAVLRVDN
jgi:hypothetical protein